MATIKMINTNCIINIYNYAAAADHEPEPEPEPERREEEEREEEREEEDEGCTSEESEDEDEDHTSEESEDEDEDEYAVAEEEEWRRLWPLGTDCADPVHPMPRESADWDIFWPTLKAWWERFGPSFFQHSAEAAGKGKNYQPTFFLLESDGNHVPPPPSFDLGYEPLWYWFITYSDEWFEEQAALSMRRVLAGVDDEDDEEILEYFPPTKKTKK